LAAFRQAYPGLQGVPIDTNLLQRVTGPAFVLLGAYRRIANSLFGEWPQHQRRPEHVTTSDFQSLLTGEHKAKALPLGLAKRPSRNTFS